MQPTYSDRLCIALAEQLQVPLLQIARLAEQSADRRVRQVSLAQIETASTAAMKLLEAYLLAIRVSDKQQQLELEPVSLSSVLHDTAHSLAQFAGQYDCALELSLGGRYGPVLANKQALGHALASLGYTLIESSAASGKKTVALHLGAHKSRSGLVAGIFGDFEQLQSAAYQRAKTLVGRARQPLATVSPGSGAGLFIADQLLEAMHTELRVVRHARRTGFGATFTPSHQLALI